MTVKPELNSSSGNPEVTVYARLDNNNQVILQELLTNVSGLPQWLFSQDGSSLEFADMVTGWLNNSKIPENNPGNPDQVCLFSQNG